MCGGMCELLGEEECLVRLLAQHNYILMLHVISDNKVVVGIQTCVAVITPLSQACTSFCIN